MAQPFESALIVKFVLIVVLLTVSALVSGAETSFFSLSPQQIDRIEASSKPSRRSIVKLLSMPDYLLATILIVNNLVNICIVILCNATLDGLVHITSPAWEFVVKTILITFVLLLFGEIMPKIFAAYNPVGFASVVATPMLGLKYFFKPFSFLLVSYSKRFAKRKPHQELSIDELSNALDITAGQSNEERERLSGIVGLVNREVVELMHPRMDITALNVSIGFDEVRKVIIGSGFSRLPVYRDSIDNIVGVLYVKDMLQFIDQPDSFDWTKYLRKAQFVPEHKMINELLDEFQQTKIHIAIVVDEYGSTLGLVSLEDILEEIVGEITDESDRKEERFYQKIDQSTYIFEAKTHICDFEDVLGVDEGLFDDVKGESETLGGMMLETKKDFLSVGDTMKMHGIRLTVQSVEGHRADKIKVVWHPDERAKKGQAKA